MSHASVLAAHARKEQFDRIINMVYNKALPKEARIKAAEDYIYGMKGEVFLSVFVGIAFVVVVVIGLIDLRMWVLSLVCFPLAALSFCAAWHNQKLRKDMRMEAQNIREGRPTAWS